VSEKHSIFVIGKSHTVKSVGDLAGANIIDVTAPEEYIRDKCALTTIILAAIDFKPRDFSHMDSVIDCI